MGWIFSSFFFPLPKTKERNADSFCSNGNDLIFGSNVVDCISFVSLVRWLSPMKSILKNVSKILRCIGMFSFFSLSPPSSARGSIRNIQRFLPPARCLFAYHWYSMPSFLNRSQLRQATSNIDMLEDRLEQVTCHWHRTIDRFPFLTDVQVVQLCCEQWQSFHSRFSVSTCSAKTWAAVIRCLFYRKFLKCIADVRELFSSDDLVHQSLATFGEYLREIQSLFSVNSPSLALSGIVPPSPSL